MTEGMVVEREPAFMWAGRPVYRCRECGDRYERVDNLEAVLEHEATEHAPAPARQRASSILGTDGEPLVVTE